MYKSVAVQCVSPQLILIMQLSGACLLLSAVLCEILESVMGADERQNRALPAMLSQVCTALEANIRLKGPPSDSGAALLTSHVCSQHAHAVKTCCCTA